MQSYQIQLYIPVGTKKRKIKLQWKNRWTRRLKLTVVFPWSAFKDRFRRGEFAGLESIYMESGESFGLRLKTLSVERRYRTKYNLRNGSKFLQYLCF